MPDDPQEKEAQILAPEQVRIIIPECCVEGYDTCPHVVKREPPKRGNIGL